LLSELVTRVRPGRPKTSRVGIVDSVAGSGAWDDRVMVDSGDGLDLVQLLGFEITVARPDEVVMEWDVDTRHHQPYGIVHGGVYCAVVESAASIGAALWLGQRGQVVGVSNRTDFLRSVRDGRLRAVATPISRTVERQLWQVEVRDARAALVARGQVDLVRLAQVR
jgi:1,4-dihydroxy-2-naphthoyl-CoA hydrolase